MWRARSLGLLAIVLAVMCVGCATASEPQAPTPLPATVPSEPSPRMVPAAATATPAAAPTLAPAPTPETITEDILFSGALSVEDLNTLILALRALPGVDNVQGGMQDLLITYEPKQVSRQKIIETIKSFGYTVKG